MNKNFENIATVHTGVLDNKKNKKEIGVICKNASNYGAKIKTFDEIESNVPTSNFQTPTSNTAITLIALIITILFSYDEMIKFSNSKGFLLQTI